MQNLTDIDPPNIPVGPTIPSVEDFSGDDVCLRDICSKAIKLFEEFRFTRGVEVIKTSTSDYFSQTVTVPVKIETVIDSTGQSILRLSLSVTLEQFEDQGPIDIFINATSSNLTTKDEDELSLDPSDIKQAQLQAIDYLKIKDQKRSIDHVIVFFQALERLVLKLQVIGNFSLRLPSSE